MIKDDINLSVALDILNRKIANLNMKLVKEPDNIEAQKQLDELLNIKKEINKGNAELVKKVINDAKIN